MDTLLARHAETAETAEAAEGARVAYGGPGQSDRDRSARELLRDAGAVAHALPERSEARPLALLGVRRDAYDCVAALLGAWARGYEVLVPPADCTREGFLRLAQRPDVGAVIHDTASTAALPIERMLASATPAWSLPDASHVPHGSLQLLVSEAMPELAPVRVTGAQLLREAALLGSSLALPERAAYACSLLASSRYAWAAGVFWPLMSGGALLRGDVREPSWSEGFRDQRPVLIAAPAQLRSLARAAAQPLRGVQRVVSLGAPLPAAGFARLRRAGLDVSDVYACQHLGSLGWRSEPAQAFQPLAEVALGVPCAGGLEVHAAHGADAPVHIERSAEGRFLAAGGDSERALYEEQIAWLDGVHEAALISLPESDRERGGWYVALSLEASAPAESSLRRRVKELLPELPIAGFRSLRLQPAAAVARLSSFAPPRCDLARNGAGRHDRTSLLRLFGRDADMAALSWTLTQRGERALDGGRYERELQVPGRYGYFAGHFPGYPILPGAAQLSELVVPFVRSVRPELGRLIRMARLKFQERIVPNDIVSVSLVFGQQSAAAESSVDFSLRRGESLCANGRLVFAAGPAATTELPT